MGGRDVEIAAGAGGASEVGEEVDGSVAGISSESLATSAESSCRMLFNPKFISRLAWEIANKPSSLMSTGTALTRLVNPEKKRKQ